MAEGPGQHRSPAVGGDARPPQEPAEDDVPPERAYVAPQELPKAAIPVDPQPDAKVVLNLPTDPVKNISEAEVRAARARRRTATVKIERAAVNDTLKMSELALQRQRAPDASSARPEPLDATPFAKTPLSGVPAAALFPESPLPGTAPRAVPSEGAAAVVTSREIDDFDPARRRSRGGLWIGVAMLGAACAGGYWLTRSEGSPGADAAAASTSAANDLANAPPQAAPSAPAEATTPPSSTGGVATAPAATSAPAIAAAPARTALRPPPQPPRPAAPPAKLPPKPTKPTKGDIPSEI